MGGRVNVAIRAFRSQSTNLGFAFPPNASTFIKASSGTTGAPVYGATFDAHAVCHGMDSAGQQSPRGRCVTSVNLIVAGLDVDDYDRTINDRAYWSLDLLLVDGFP